MEDIQKFLSDFGNPLIKLLPESFIPGAISNINQVRSLETSIELNKQVPSGLFFTPNGDRGLINKIGDQARFADRLYPSGGLINAFCVDFDLKDYSEIKTKEHLISEIRLRIKALNNIKPTYIIESVGGFHVYRVIKKDDRKFLYEMYGKSLLKVSAYLAEMLGADTNCRASFSASALMRLPGSMHWKTKEAKPVNILEYNSSYIDAKIVSDSMNHINKVLETNKVNSDVQKVMGGMRHKEVTDIPMPILLAKLEKYPRLINGEEQVIKIEGSQVVLYGKKSGGTKWNSYKYNASENYIICFYDGDMYQAPQGNGIGFLYWYFNKDMARVYQFLNEEFDISLDNTKIHGETVLYKISNMDYTIIFSDKTVRLEIQTAKADGHVATIKKILFRTPMTITGKGTTSSLGMGESDEERNVYTFKVGQKDYIMERIPTKREFNKRYQGICFFYGIDNDLGLFYEAIENCEDVPDLDVFDTSGIYDKHVVLGNNIVIGSHDNVFINSRENFPITDAEPISLTGYLEKFRNIYKDEIAIPAFLQAIALAGMNAWTGFTTYPGLLISGFTGSGKSSIADNLKTLLGYGLNARKLALPGITPQPLKQSAGDSSILFLDELTKKVGSVTEELLRNVINRDRAARGSGDLNINFIFRSPLFVTGERTFKDESLNNRFVSLVISEKYWKPGAKELVNDLLHYTAYKDIYNTYLYNQVNLSEMAKGYSTKLASDGISPRNADTWAFMFVVNDLFSLGFEYDYLLNITNMHLDRMGLNRKYVKTPIESLEILLIKILAQKVSKLIIKDIGKGHKQTDFNFVLLSDEKYQEMRGTVIPIANEINTEIGKEVIEVDQDNIHIYVSNCSGLSDKEQELKTAILNVIQVSDRGSVVNTSDFYTK